MFQRLKGAIDSRIAEEQARQRSALTSPPPPHAARKPSSRAESPAKRALRPGTPSRYNGEGSGKGPDPADFEPECVIDDSNPPSRSGTPKPGPARSESSTKDAVQEAPEEAGHGEEQAEKVADSSQAAAPAELPTDVRVKLRKLEKLESRYHELLRSYKVAHARVQTIDSFEASLKENTPLTSINDPRALVEYLNQLNLKGDMVLDELKRVSHDRDTYKRKLNDAEKRTREAWDEVTNLRQAKDTGDSNDDQPRLDTSASTTQNPPTNQPDVGRNSSDTMKSPSSSAKSRTGSLTSLSIFSPKAKAAESPVIKESREDLFSYDDEIPRLQSELKDRDRKVEDLQSEVTNLRRDLVVTRESTQSMVQTLEEATRELNTLRDHKDRSTIDLEEQREASKKLIDKLQADLTASQAKLQELQTSTNPEAISRCIELEQKLEQANHELEILRGKAKDLSDKANEVTILQQKFATLEGEISEARAKKEQSEKKADTAASLVKTLRQQLAEKEGMYEYVVNSATILKDSIQDQIREETAGEKVSYASATGSAGKEMSPNGAARAPIEPSESTIDVAAPGKKKNKKKKKGAKSVGEQMKEPQTSSGIHVTEGVPEANRIVPEAPENAEMLRGELEKCKQQLEEKDVALEKIRSKLQDQDDLKEEIESLRDDLINVGQGHVQAKDQMKELEIEKRALKDTVASLEHELAQLQGLHDSNSASSDKKHQDLTGQFEDLTIKATGLQTDLSAAQQLATSRFKELSDLRAVMQKAQPELTSLRAELGELRSIREDHGRRQAEIKDLEIRQDNMRAEITSQKRIIGERETEIKSINHKLDQETSSRSRAEEARNKMNEEIQSLETEKRQAAESLNKFSKDISMAHEEIVKLKARLKELEPQVTGLRLDNEGLKDEIELKTAQYASAQSLMSSMRDQTTEMAVQMKEARDRCESLDEEVADAHRLLSERSREGETMRRLLAEVEGKADARTREMKERMNNLVDERDRAEDEASMAARRRARELDELKTKVREAERSLKRMEEDKEELEIAQRDWKRRREELEHRSEQSAREAGEVREAMGELRDALDESERQARETEKQKAGLRKSLEDTHHRLEKLQKSNKSMADEIRAIELAKKRGIDSEAQSSRSSTDSVPSRARLASPMPASRQGTAMGSNTPNGQVAGSMDFVYLKNVLLQFLEQKDKNHQKQLIPVLGMLLHFDRFLSHQSSFAQKGMHFDRLRLWSDAVAPSKGQVSGPLYHEDTNTVDRHGAQKRRHGYWQGGAGHR
ncbi:MAG: hypothetical protein Q9219_000543 [cf. Caloplaca sp. 3 TL-2023]